MNEQTLRRCQADPAAFRSNLFIIADEDSFRLSDALDPWQRTDFEALDPGWQRVVQGGEAPFSRAWLERPRGHSKSQDLAIMAAWALFASRKPIAGFAGAGDRDQARLLRDAIGRLLHVNPWLANFLDVQNYRVVNPNTGSTLEILSSDAPTSYGLLPDFIVCDEVVHWRNRDLWDSLLSSAAKRNTCMLVCISNAGLQDDWAWQLREAVRQDDSWYFSRLEGPVASWIDRSALEEQERLLPSIAYRRLWLNEWTAGGGDALPEDVIDAAFKPDLTPQGAALPDYEYVAGLDIGLTRDASAVCVLGVKRSHDGHGRIVLASTHVWKPMKGAKVDLQAVENHLLVLNQWFRLKQLNYDPWQADHLASRLQSGGLVSLDSRHNTAKVPAIQISPSGANLQAMASTLLQAFNDRRVDLYEEPNLRRDLKRLRVEERNYGFRLVSPRDEHGHGDLVTAFSLALLAASELAAKRVVKAGVVTLDDQSNPIADLIRLERGGADYAGRETFSAIMSSMARGRRW